MNKGCMPPQHAGKPLRPTYFHPKNLRIADEALKVTPKATAAAAPGTDFARSILGEPVEHPTLGRVYPKLQKGFDA